MKRLVWVISLCLSALLMTAAFPLGVRGAGQVTLTWWSMWNPGEPQMQVLDKIAKDFEQANPSIKVNVLWGGRGILAKVRQTLMTGNPPDLVDKDADEMGGAFISNGQAVPLDDVVNAKIDGESNTVGAVVPKADLNQFYLNGHYYLIPYEVISSGFWYNGAQAGKFGLTNPPKTWDEFITLVKTLKAKGIAPMAIDPIGIYGAYNFYWLAERFGGPGAFDKAAGDKTGAAWDNPMWAKVSAADADLIALKPYQPGYEGSKYPAGQNVWAQGNAAMLLMGSWAPSETAKMAAPGFQFRMFGFPQVPGGKNSVEVYLIGWSIPKGAKQVDAAKKFMLYAMNKTRLQGIIDVAKNLTPRTDMPAPPELKDVKAILESGAPAHRIYDGVQTDYPGWWQTVFIPLDDQLILGKLTGPAFLSQLKQNSINYYKTNSR